MIYLDTTGLQWQGGKLRGEVAAFCAQSHEKLHEAHADPYTPAFLTRFIEAVDFAKPGAGPVARDKLLGEVENRKMAACDSDDVLALDDWDELDAARFDPGGGADKTPGSPAYSGVSSAFRRFPVELLPDPVGAYVRSAASAIGCDPTFVALPLLAALASAIGNNRRVKLKSGWVEPCVLWMVPIGNSGTVKSPPIEAATRVVRRRQAKLFAEYDKKKTEHAAALKAWKKLDKDKRDRSPEPEPPEPCERLWCADVTIEAVAVLLADAPRGLLVWRDELSAWYGSFDRYSGAGRASSDVANWLEAYGGREMLVDRKTGERKVIHVPRAAVCVTGGIQPGTLNRVFTREYFECGMVARTLFAYPPTRQKQWREEEVSDALERKVDAAFDALYALKPDADTNGKPAPVDLPLTETAKEAFKAFVNQTGKEQAQRADDSVVAAWSKLEGAAARLALVIQLIRDPDAKAVDGASIEAGITLARWFGHEAERVYAALAETEDDRDQRRLCEWIAAQGYVVGPRDVTRALNRRYPKADDADAAMAKLVDAGLGEWVHPPRSGNGRPADHRFRLYITDGVLPDGADKTPDNHGGNGSSVGANGRKSRWASKPYCPDKNGGKARGRR